MMGKRNKINKAARRAFRRRLIAGMLAAGVLYR